MLRKFQGNKYYPPDDPRLATSDSLATLAKEQAKRIAELRKTINDLVDSVNRANGTAIRKLPMSAGPLDDFLAAIPRGEVLGTNPTTGLPAIESALREGGKDSLTKAVKLAGGDLQKVADALAKTAEDWPINKNSYRIKGG